MSLIYDGVSVKKVIYNGIELSKVIYKVGSTSTVVWQKTTGPTIPAGTYYPSTFRDLLGKFVSKGNKRSVAAPCTVSCNGTSYTCKSYVSYTEDTCGVDYKWSYAGFDTTKVGAWTMSQKPFSEGHAYCLNNNGPHQEPQLGDYAYYSITLGSDLIFK